MKLDPYLNFDGDCREAFEFYARVFGGTVDMMQTHGESPIAQEVPSDWHDLILHASLRSGDLLLMGSDAPPGRYEKPAGLYVSIALEDVKDAERIFGELSDGGREVMALEETFWAARFGMVIDRYGIPWMVNCA